MSIDPIELAKKLIECKSITPSDAGAISVIEAALKSLGFICHSLNYEGIHNLYARLGNKSPNICFAGHTDVVPPGDLTAWKSDPFKPEVRDGKLYGRGASDMKPAIAAFISATAEFIKENSPVDYSISFLITGDEEGDAINGTRKVLEWLKEKNEKIDYCVVGEPTNPKILGEMVKIGRRGSITLKLKVKGIQGHAAYPNIANNPITALVEMLHTFKLRPLDDGTEYFEPSNLEITTIDVGNNASNVIPGEASATFNIRFNDLYSSKKLIDWTKAVIETVSKKYKTEYTLTHHITGEAFLNKPSILSEVMINAVKGVTGRTPTLSTTGGTSDARFIKDICPVVEFGLINETAHKIDENSKIEDILNLKKIYKLFLEQITS